jgi:hypothetical protein
MVKKDNELRTYEDIVNFVTVLPGSNPPKGMMANTLGGHTDATVLAQRTYEMEQAMNAEEALHVFNKYKIAVHDRKRLILAILNVKKPE